MTTPSAPRLVAVAFAALLFCAPLLVRAQPTPTPAPAGNAAPAATTPAPAATTPAADGVVPATGLTPVKPDLSVPIPGITFTNAYNDGDDIVVPYLAQYISGLYRYMLGISTLVAIIVVVYGGFQYLLGSTVGSTKLGMTLIKDAIAGLVVLYTSYIILYTVNPNLVNLQPIRLSRIQTVMLGEDISADADPTEDTGGSSQCRLKYNQGAGAWAQMPFGGSPQLISTKNDSRTACATAALSNGSTCIGTFAQAACGPTSVASILASYGLQISVSSRVPSPGNAMHLIDPIDTAIFAIEKGYRVIARGTSAAVASNADDGFPQFQTRHIANNDTVSILNSLRANHPLFFYCRGVTLYTDDAATTPITGRAGNTALYSGSGHYMVLSGVVSDQILRVHDVGNGRSKTIRMDNLQQNCGGIVEIKPKANYQPTVTTTWGSTTVTMTLPAAAAQGGQCTATAGAPAPTGSVRGTVLSLPFNYLPAGQTVANWPADSARILYPERLRNVRDARVHVMIYLHGDNSGSDGNNAPEASYIPHLKPALEQVAGAKDVVIFTPHHSAAGNAYPGFVLNTFYNEALTQLRTVMPGVTVIDTVVGGHSGATCKGGPTLRQAITGATPGLRGIIAYDGCAGGPLGDSQFLSPDNFSPPSGVALYINPDLSGMGHGSVPSATGGRTTRNLSVRSMWGNLSSQTCPVCARDQGSVACYAPNATYQRPGGGELISFETGAGHGGSVDVMTKIALCAFYANRSTVQQATP